MKSIKEFWERVKSAYKGFAMIPLIAFALTVADTLFSKFLETHLSPCQRYILFLTISFICLIPLLNLIISEVKGICTRSRQFVTLSSEVSSLQEENGLLKAENSRTSKNLESLQLFTLELINEYYQEFLFDVRYAYMYDNVVYINLVETGNQILGPKSEVFLIDIEDGYQLGLFTDAKQKSDGIHMKSLGEVDRLLFSKLLEHPELILKPTIRAVQIVKKEKFTNGSN